MSRRHKVQVSRHVPLFIMQRKNEEAISRLDLFLLFLYTLTDVRSSGQTAGKSIVDRHFSDELSAQHPDPDLRYSFGVCY